MRTVTLKLEDEAICDRVEAALAAAGLFAERIATNTYMIRPIPDYLCKADRDVADRLVNLKGYAP